MDKYTEGKVAESIAGRDAAMRKARRLKAAGFPVAVFHAVRKARACHHEALRRQNII